ncbi:MAG TPA: prolipoprotein diacylglyceryl transferase family protein, partial [Cyclobacteriaceae bacterium]|nr:prolipoprotein diacylglyceryl transferase family protein [Cyclobacteriaceae bacterium]
MNPLLTIDTPHGDFYYSMFYFLAFIAGFVMLVMEGRKRKFPEMPWLVVITTSFLFFIVGTQAIRLSMEDWQHVSQFKALEYFPGRSVLGGILFAIPGLLLTKYILGFREDVMDAFVFAAPMGLLIQRLGCLMAGCCYGTTTSVPWGIQYGTSSPV